MGDDLGGGGGFEFGEAFGDGEDFFLAGVEGGEEGLVFLDAIVPEFGGEEVEGEDAGDDDDEGDEELEECGEDDAFLALGEGLGAEGALDDVIG